MTVLTLDEPEGLTVSGPTAPPRRSPWLPILSVVVVAVCTIAGAALGFGLQDRATPEYQAEASVIVQSTAAELLLRDDRRSQEELDRSISTDVQLLQDRRAELELEALAGAAVDYDVIHRDDTDLIVISARSTSAETAAEHADLIARYYVEERAATERAELEAAAAALEAPVASLVAALEVLDAQVVEVDGVEVIDRSLLAQIVAVETELAANRAALEQLRVELSISDGGARVVGPAIVPTETITPTPQRVATLYGVIGFGLGIVAVWLIVQADIGRRLRHGAEV